MLAAAWPLDLCRTWLAGWCLSTPKHSPVLLQGGDWGPAFGGGKKRKGSFGGGGGRKGGGGGAAGKNAEPTEEELQAMAEEVEAEAMEEDGDGELTVLVLVGVGASGNHVFLVERSVAPS